MAVQLRAGDVIRRIVERVDLDAVHRAGAGQLLGAARVPALPPAARGRARLGALEHRPGDPLAGRRPAARPRPTWSASASAPGCWRRTGCRPTSCRPTSGAARATPGPRCSTRPARTSAPRWSRAPTCCSSSSTASRSCSRTPTSRPARRRRSRRRSAAPGRCCARACAGEEPSGEDLQLAERIGFELSGAYRPFVLVAPGVVGAAPPRARRAAARPPPAGRVRGAPRRRPRAPQGPLARAGRGPARRDRRRAAATPPRRAARGVRGAARGGRGRGRARAAAGAVDVGRPPGRAAAAPLAAARRPRCARACTSQLAAHDPELTRTLDALIEHDFDRGATAAALPVHRNTLTNRLNRDPRDHGPGRRPRGRARPALAGLAGARGQSSP